MILDIDRRAIDKIIEGHRDHEWQFTETSAIKAREALNWYRDTHIEPESRIVFDELIEAKIDEAMKLDTQRS